MPTKNKDTITRLLKIIVLIILLGWCFLIVQPFLLIVLWAIILAVALFPVYRWILNKFGVTRKKLITVGFALIVSFLVMFPTVIITKSITATTVDTVKKVRSNSFEIPAPDKKVKDWPLIGEKLYTNWLEASKDIKHYAVDHKEFILEQGSKLFSGFKGFIAAAISFFASLILAVVFMYHSKSATQAASVLFYKLAGKDGEELIHMSRDVIKSVVKGILLVAIIQSSLAFIGFKMIDLPGAGIFTFIILVTAIVQIPAILTMIPAILLAFSISDTTPAIIFAVYCILVGLSDNFLKPMLLGKGLQTPMIVILIGTIGGMLLHGIIGLFLGAVVLAVMYRLYQYWVNVSIIS